MSKIEAKLLPRDLFLVKGSDGNVHWFLNDPMNNSSLDNETNIAEEIFAFVGTGDIANPVMVRIQCAHINRCQPFNPEWPGRIRRGEVKKHLQDITGAQVDIISSTNRSDFPFNGAVLNEDGSVSCVRTYNEEGECSDGISEHSIFVMENAEPEEEDIQ